MRARQPSLGVAGASGRFRKSRYSSSSSRRAKTGRFGLGGSKHDLAELSELDGYTVDLATYGAEHSRTSGVCAWPRGPNHSPEPSPLASARLRAPSQAPTPSRLGAS